MTPQVWLAIGFAAWVMISFGFAVYMIFNTGAFDDKDWDRDDY